MHAEDDLPPARKRLTPVSREFRLLAAFILLSQLMGCSAQQHALPLQPTEPALATIAPTATTHVVATATADAVATASVAATVTAKTATATTQAALMTRPEPTTAALKALRAKIEIVWPHAGASVREATQANLTAYIMAVDSYKSPPCEWEPTVRLWAALNAEPAREIAIAEKRMLETGGRIFPVWDFNDIDVSAARDPFNKLSFYVTVDDTPTYHNIWVHAQDARTIQAAPNRPTELLDQPPAKVDARIEIVWPHGGLPVEQAELANITAALFEAGTLAAVSADASWNPVVRLHHSLNADAELPTDTPIVGERRAIPLKSGDAMPVWDFNDVKVSAAQDRLNKIYFWVSVDDVETFPNIWAHGADTPTVFPQVDVLESCQ